VDTSKRPVPRMGDHLDELLDLLDRAREEQRARSRRFTPRVTPYLDLARQIADRLGLRRAG
jgi:hypothetical protein